jgi:putative ABC transport system substrate-binding protein
LEVPADFRSAVFDSTSDGARGCATLTLRHRLPSIFHFREFVEAGGLMSYGANQAELLRRAASYVDKILRGVKPTDLPVEQATTFEFVIT